MILQIDHFVVLTRVDEKFQVFFKNLLDYFGLGFVEVLKTCSLGMVGRCSWVSWGVVGFLFMGISVDKLNTNLFGEGQFNINAGWFTQFSNTLGNRDRGIFNFWDRDAFFFSEFGTGNTWEVDWFVNTGLDWFGVGDGYIYINWGDNGHVVGGFLGNFIAVLVSISTMSITSMSVTTSISGLADGDHLGFGFLLEGYLDSLGDGCFILRCIGVGADFLWDDFDGFSADGSHNRVALFLGNNDLDGQFNISAFGGDGWCAYLGGFSYINDRAVVLWLFISISSICRSWVSISWGRMTIGWGRVAICWGRLISTISWGWVAGESLSSAQDGKDGDESLHDVFDIC